MNKYLEKIAYIKGFNKLTRKGRKDRFHEAIGRDVQRRRPHGKKIAPVTREELAYEVSRLRHFAKTDVSLYGKSPQHLSVSSPRVTGRGKNHPEYSLDSKPKKGARWD